MSIEDKIVVVLIMIFIIAIIVVVPLLALAGDASGASPPAPPHPICSVDAECEYMYLPVSINGFKWASSGPPE